MRTLIKYSISSHRRLIIALCRDEAHGDHVAGREGSWEAQYRFDSEAAGKYGKKEQLSTVFCTRDSPSLIGQELHDSDFGKREEIHKIKKAKQLRVEKLKV